MTGPAFQFHRVSRGCHTFNFCNSCKQSSNRVPYFPQLWCWLCCSFLIPLSWLELFDVSKAPTNTVVKVTQCLVLISLPWETHYRWQEQGRRGAFSSIGCDADHWRHLGRVQVYVCALYACPNWQGFACWSVQSYVTYCVRWFLLRDRTAFERLLC